MASSPSLSSRARFGAAVAVVIAAVSSPLAAQKVPPAPAGVGRIEGTVTDGVHGGPLAGAVIFIDGVYRIGQTGPDGQYSIDSIPPGSYRLHLSHPVLDTIGMTVTTPPTVVRPNEVVTLDMALPTGDKIIGMLCPPGSLARGPGAFVGQVVDPESNKPAVGSKVQLLYEPTNPLGIRMPPTIRETTVDSSGGYRLCGLPTPVEGKLQLFRNGVTSGQVDVRLDREPLGLRSFSIAATRVATTVVDSAGQSKQVVVGNARLAGRVVNKAGAPVAAARVSLEGVGTATLTNDRGDFHLDSLPPGTQSVEVRKLGYGETTQSVELSGKDPASVTVVMSDYTLPAMRVAADRETALSNIGYTDRKKRGMGFFLDGDKIRGNAPHFSDIVRQAPMLKLTPTDNGKNVIQDARDPNMGCVTFVVDGVRWQELSPGDIDDYLQPSELQAVEVYNPSTVPAQFQTPGSTACTTVVAWTIRGLNRARKK